MCTYSELFESQPKHRRGSPLTRLPLIYDGLAGSAKSCGENCL
jgi:hypothetical protein